MYKFLICIAIFSYNFIVINPVIANDAISKTESQISIPNTDKEFSDLLAQVESLVEKENFTLAYAQLQQVYTEIEPGNNQAAIVLKWLTFINLEKNWGRVEEVVKFAYAAIDTTTDQNIKFQLSHQIANSELSQGHFPQAEKCFKTALEVPEADEISKEQTYYLLGVSQAQQGKLPEALASMQLAYQIQESTFGKPSAQILTGLGVLNNYMQQFEQAIKYTEEAIAATEANSPGLIKLYSNLSAMYTDQKDYQAALTTISKAEEIAKENNMLVSGPLVNKGAIYGNLGRYQDALDTYFYALELASQDKEVDQIAIIVTNIGHNYKDLGDHEKAAQYLEQAYQLFSENDQRVKRLQLYPVIIENYQALSNFERALELMIEYKTLYDETISLESQEKFNHSQSEFELARKEKELIASQLEEALKEQSILQLTKDKMEQKSTQHLLISIVIIISLILIFLLLAYRIKTRAYLQVKELSLRDQLTNLLNRRAIHHIIQMEVNRFNRKPIPFSLVLLDIDYFKRLNDSYGHECGDIVLKAVAKTLTSTLRSSDEVARWGGEEFLILLPETTAEQAYHIAEKVRLAIANIVVSYNEKSITTSVSLGISEFNGLNHYEDVIKQADEALYSAKEQGRNISQLYDHDSA